MRHGSRRAERDRRDCRCACRGRCRPWSWSRRRPLRPCGCCRGTSAGSGWSRIESREPAAAPRATPRAATQRELRCRHRMRIVRFMCASSPTARPTAVGCGFGALRMIFCARQAEISDTNSSFGVAAVDLVDRAELAQALAGLAELADDRAVQLHLVDLAGDGPRRGRDCCPGSSSRRTGTGAAPARRRPPTGCRRCRRWPSELRSLSRTCTRALPRSPT